MKSFRPTRRDQKLLFRRAEKRGEAPTRPLQRLRSSPPRAPRVSRCGRSFHVFLLFFFPFPDLGLIEGARSFGFSKFIGASDTREYFINV